MSRQLEYNISGCSLFQQKTVEDICRKFYDENKRKVVLADEVGMGKTYVCKGIIENLKKILGVDGVPSILYIAPNEVVAKQNHSELCKGFYPSDKDVNESDKGANESDKDVNESDKAKEVNKVNKKVATNAKQRLSMVHNQMAFQNKEGKRIFSIRTFSASMFFGTDQSTMGTREERIHIYKCLREIYDVDGRLETANWWDAEIINVCLILLLLLEERKEEKIELCGLIDLHRLEDWVEGEKPSLEDQEKEYGKQYFSEREPEIGILKEFKTWRIENNIEGELKEKDCSKKEDKENAILEVCIRFRKEWLGEGEELKKNKKKWNKKRQNLFFELRKLLNRINIQYQMPDLIILDEFHKYFEKGVQQTVLDEYLKLKNLENTKVIFVSATPYKMKNIYENYNFGEEDDKVSEDNNNCFGDYRELYNYLAGGNIDGDNNSLKEGLDVISRSLEFLAKCENREDFRACWEECKEKKEMVQGILSQYIVRTERHTYNVKWNNYSRIEDFKLDAKCLKYEADQFTYLNEILNKPNISLEYTKMAPFPLSFGQGYSTFEIDRKKKYDSKLFWDGEGEPNHFRYQQIKNIAFPSEAYRKALWVPPSNIIQDDDNENGFPFWNEIKEFTKTLIFAKHRVATRSIAAIASRQCQKDSGIVENYSFLEKSDEAEIEGTDFIFGYFNELLQDCEETKKMAKELSFSFYKYLAANKNVLSLAGVYDKQSLESYCRAGHLREVLEEYLFVLTKGGKCTEDNVIEFLFALTNPENTIHYLDKNKKVENVKCNYAEQFGAGKKGGEIRDKKKNGQELLQTKFNSPFYPFILASTAVAQEGLNFQYYCHRVVHWKEPTSPIDFEQREGRIVRYRSHAVRKSWRKNYPNKTWKEVFGKEDLGGLSPNWIVNRKEIIPIESYIITQPYSKERKRLEAVEASLENYRVSLGYGVKKEMLNEIKEKAKMLEIGEIDWSEILLDLSPK